MPEIFMPRLSDTMEEGTLSTWLKNVGDRVEKGDVLADIETDKATMELEAYDAGVLERVLVQPGETVPIGTPIAVIGSGEGVSGAAKQAGPAQPAPPTPAPSTVRAAEAQEPPGRIATPVPEPAAAVSPQPSHDERVRATPVARALARDRGIDLRLVKGRGPGVPPRRLSRRHRSPRRPSPPRRSRRPSPTTYRKSHSRTCGGSPRGGSWRACSRRRTST